MPTAPHPASCRGCPLNQLGKGFAQIDGKGRKNILVVPEALGESEMRDSLPLRPYAQAGSIFERALLMLGLTRNDVVIRNVVNCFLGDTIVSSFGVQKVYRHWYSGDLVTLTLESGKILTGTPNHPVFTNRGLLPLKVISKGDNLFDCSDAKWMRGSDPDVNNRPTRIDDLFNSLSVSDISVRTIGSNMDFHGDGGQSYVDVIIKNGLLRDGIETKTFEQVNNLSLKSSNGKSILLSRTAKSLSRFSNTFRRLFSPSKSFVSSLSKSFSNSDRGFTHSQQHSRTSGTGFNPINNELSFEPALAYSMFDSQWFQPLSGKITFDKVVDINIRRFSGHVYNLQTEYGKYTASGYLVSNCRPPNNVLSGAPYAQGAINHCRPNLEEVFNKYDIKVILALGSVALESLTGLQGKKLNLSSVRGYPIWSEEFNVPVIATYHPAFIARGQKNLLGVFYRDFHRAIQIADGTLKLGSDFYLNPQEEYICDYHTVKSESEMEVEIGLIKPEDTIAFDTETERSLKVESEDQLTSSDIKLTHFQWSTAKGHARVVRWKKDYIPYIQNILHRPNIKIGFNSWLYDQPVLEAHGLTISEPHHDVMSMFHHYEPDLPMGLQYVASLFGWGFPWKHLSSTDIEFYSMCDVDVLHYIYPVLRDLMQRQGVYGNF